MTDILSSLPDFPINQYSHLLPSLDRNLITLSDLLTLDPTDVARRAQLPPGEVRKLLEATVRALHEKLGYGQGQDGRDGASLSGSSGSSAWHAISTLSPALDAVLGGAGVPVGYITEIVGESGAGKTQLLLTLLLAVQLPLSHGGLSASALYISTEAGLSTPRLAQLIRAHPRLASVRQDERPSLSRILTLQTPDLESQDHILRYQVPIAIRQHGVRLLIIDSIAANYRVEFERKGSDDRDGGEKPRTLQDSRMRRSGAQAMAARRAQLVQLGSLLRNIARDHDVAVVVSNQVADRFGSDPLRAAAPQTFYPTSAQSSADERISTAPAPGAFARPGLAPRSASSPQPEHSSAPARVTPPEPRRASPLPQVQPWPVRLPLTLDHQQRFFTGWGDIIPPYPQAQHFKTPSLGLVWANQLACRIALIRDSAAAQGPTRHLRVVFCAWAPPAHARGVEFEIWEGGVRAVEEADREESTRPGHDATEPEITGEKRKRQATDAGDDLD